jgi:uracil-DNA glycosylase
MNNQVMKLKRMTILRSRVLGSSVNAACDRCALAKERTCIVFGDGPVDARLMVVGEAPGKQEDAIGQPFVGKSGQLLDGCLQEAGTVREQVYVTNAVKCYPPGCRDPSNEELHTCRPYLVEQIHIVKPRVLVTLGKTAAYAVLRLDVALGDIRGQLHLWKGVWVIPTYHPAFVLCVQAKRETFVDDLRQAYTLSLKK